MQSNEFSVAIINQAKKYDGVSQHALDLYGAARLGGLSARFYQLVIPGQELRFFTEYDSVPAPALAGSWSLKADTLLGLNWRPFRHIRASVVHLSESYLFDLVEHVPGCIPSIHDLYYFDHPGEVSLEGVVHRSKYHHLERASHIIAITEFTRSRLLHHFPSLQGKVTTVYNSVDLEFFSPGPGTFQWPGPEGDRFLVLSVGGDRPHKNIELLLQILSRLPRRFKLLHAGYLSTRTRRRVRELDLESRTLQYDSPDMTTLRNLYRSCDVLATTSTYEGMGRPPLEAMACGLPTLITEAPALQEISGGAGVTLPWDATDAAGVVASLTREILDKHRALGLQRARTFSRESQLASLRRVYGYFG
jgi:glycosyltransferase involved in cell wall biosynthesis